MTQYVDQQEEILKQVHNINYNNGNIKDTVTTNKVNYAYDQNGNKIYTSGVVTETRVVPVTMSLFQERQRSNWYQANTTDKVIWNVSGYNNNEDTYTNPTALAALSRGLKAGLSPSSGSGSSSSSQEDSLSSNSQNPKEDKASSPSSTNSLSKVIDEHFSKLVDMPDANINQFFTRGGGGGGGSGGGAGGGGKSGGPLGGLGGGGGAASKLGGGVSALKNAFDGVMSKGEQYKGFVENAKNTGMSKFEQVKSTAQGYVDKAKSTIDQAKSTAQGYIDKAKSTIDQVKQTAQGYIDQANELKDAALGKISSAQDIFNQIKEKGMGMLDQVTGTVNNVLGQIDQFDLSTIINKFNLGDSEVLSVLASNLGISTGMFDSFASDIINSGITFVKDKFEETGLSDRLYGSIGLALKNSKAYDWVILNSIVKPLRATANIDLNADDTLLRLCLEYDLPLTLEYLDSYNGTVYNFDRGKAFIERAYECSKYGGFKVPKYICNKLYDIYKANTTGCITDNEELAYRTKTEIIGIFKSILVYSYDFSVSDLNEWTRDFIFLNDFSYYGENDTQFNNQFIFTDEDIDTMASVISVERNNGRLYPSIALSLRDGGGPILGGTWSKQEEYLVLRNRYLKQLYVSMAKDGSKSYERLLVHKALYERLKLKTLDGVASTIKETLETFKISDVSSNMQWLKSIGSNALTNALEYLESNNLIRPLSARGNVSDNKTDIGDWVNYANKTSGSISSIVNELAGIESNFGSGSSIVYPGSGSNSSGSSSGSSSSSSSGTTSGVSTTTGQSKPIVVEVPSQTQSKKDIIEDTGYDYTPAVKPIVIDSTSSSKDDQNEIKSTLKDVVKPIEFELMPASYADFKLIDITDLSQTDIEAIMYNVLKESPYYESVFQYSLKRFSSVSNTYADERKFIMYTTKKDKFLSLSEEQRLNVFYHVLVYNMMVKYAYAYIYADNMNLPGSIASASTDISGGTGNIDINIIVTDGYDYAFDIEKRNLVFPDELYGDVNEVVTEIENRDINFPTELYKDIELPDGTSTSTEPVTTVPATEVKDPLIEDSNINFEKEI